MKIYTIGFTQKTAREFFEKIKENNIDMLIDIRLNNASQLAGFAKGKDLEFFLKKICNCEYVHDDFFAPTKELLDNYRSKKTSWKQYEEEFADIMKTRDITSRFKNNYIKKDRICLLCTEPTPEQCHRRLVAEHLKNNIEGIEVVHI